MTRLFDVADCPACGSDRLALIDIDEASTCQDCGETLVRASPTAAWERFAEYFGSPGGGSGLIRSRLLTTLRDTSRPNASACNASRGD